MARAASSVVIGVLIGLCPPPTLATGGYSGSALRVEAVTDTLPGLGALAYATGTGAPVERTYRLSNHSEATIVDAEVDDPDAGGLVRCGPGGRREIDVAAWSSVTCTVRFPAIVGTHRTRVVAAGVVSGVGTAAIAFADAGYYAVSPKLRLRETVGGGRAVPVGTALPVTYALSNEGDIGLANVSVSDNQPVGALDCGLGGSGIGALTAGASRACTARLRVAAGAHSGSAKAVGTEALRSISVSGPGAPTSVEGVTSSSYVGVVPSRHPAPVRPRNANAAFVVTPSTQQTAPAPVASQHTGQPQGQGPGGSPGRGGGAAGAVAGHGGYSLPALVRHHRRAFSLLMVLLIVALVPAVLHLVRRGSSAGA